MDQSRYLAEIDAWKRVCFDLKQDIAAARLAGKVEGLQEALQIADKYSSFAEYRACTNEAAGAKESALDKMEAADEIRISIRAKITELKATTTPVSPELPDEQ